MEKYMDFMMKILYLLENLRCSVLDFFFLTVTTLGEETVFLVVSIMVFWCVDKRRGYYVLITGLVGTAANQGLKLMCKIPRPWVYDPNFQAVGGSVEAATGYSFPSGHTQNVTGTFGCIAKSSKHKAIRIACFVIIGLVAFSRMYLGVHTLADVLVSLAIGFALVFLLYPMFKSEESFEKFMPYIAVASTVISLGLLIYVFTLDRTSLDAENLHSGMKNASTLFGCTLGLIPVYFLDKRFTNFKTDGKWYSQIIKLVLGLAGVLAIKAGLSSPLAALFGNEFIARGVRYFLIVVFAGLVWPLTFNFFSKLRIKALDSFSERLKAKFAK